MDAFLNVKINAGEIEDTTWLEDILNSAAAIQQKCVQHEREILRLVEAKI